MVAIRRWPARIRCSVARWPPATSPGTTAGKAWSLEVQFSSTTGTFAPWRMAGTVTCRVMIVA
jgi:hypothetical protein